MSQEAPDPRQPDDPAEPTVSGNPGGPVERDGATAVPDGTDRDPGLQPERTRLAWRRTTLSCAVVAVLAIRQALHTGGGVVPAAAMGLAVVAFLVFLRLAHLRMQRLGVPQPPGLPAWVVVSVVGCTVAIAVFGAALLY